MIVSAPTSQRGCTEVGPRHGSRPPAGHSGEGAAVDDFTTDIIPVDYVPPQNGEDATNTSLTVFIEQFFTDDFRVFADILYSEHEAYQEYRTATVVRDCTRCC